MRKGNKNPNWKGGDILVNCCFCSKEKYVRRYRGLMNKNHFCNHRCYGLFQEKDQNNLNKRLRWTNKYKLWSRKVKEFYGNKCIRCWEIKPLETHHLIPFRNLIKKFKNKEEAMNDKNLWSINHSIPLCFECHSSMDEKRNNFKKL